MPDEFLDLPISKFVNTKLVVAAGNLSITDAIKTMLDSRVNSILVFEGNEVIGIVTDKDFLVKVVAKGLDPTKITIKEIMSKPLITIHNDAKIKDAIQLLQKHDIRRLIVKDDKRTIGTISQKKIIGNLRDYAVLLPEFELPDKIKCPYCQSLFENRSLLLSHIGNSHTK